MKTKKIVVLLLILIAGIALTQEKNFAAEPSALVIKEPITIEKYLLYLTSTAAEKDLYQAYDHLESQIERVWVDDHFEYQLANDVDAEAPLKGLTQEQAKHYCNWVEEDCPTTDRGGESTGLIAYSFAEGKKGEENPEARHHLLQNEEGDFEIAETEARSSPLMMFSEVEEKASEKKNTANRRMEERWNAQNVQRERSSNVGVQEQQTKVHEEVTGAIQTAFTRRDDDLKEQYQKVHQLRAEIEKIARLRQEAEEEHIRLEEKHAIAQERFQNERAKVKQIDPNKTWLGKFASGFGSVTNIASTTPEAHVQTASVPMQIISTVLGGMNQLMIKRKYYPAKVTERWSSWQTNHVGENLTKMATTLSELKYEAKKAREALRKSEFEHSIKIAQEYQEPLGTEEQEWASWAAILTRGVSLQSLHSQLSQFGREHSKMIAEALEHSWNHRMKVSKQDSDKLEEPEYSERQQLEIARLAFDQAEKEWSDQQQVLAAQKAERNKLVEEQCGKKISLTEVIQASITLGKQYKKTPDQEQKKAINIARQQKDDEATTLQEELEQIQKDLIQYEQRIPSLKAGVLQAALKNNELKEQYEALQSKIEWDQELAWAKKEADKEAYQVIWEPRKELKKTFFQRNRGAFQRRCDAKTDEERRKAEEYLKTNAELHDNNSSDEVQRRLLVASFQNIQKENIVRREIQAREKENIVSRRKISDQLSKITQQKKMIEQWQQAHEVELSDLKKERIELEANKESFNDLRSQIQELIETPLEHATAEEVEREAQRMKQLQGGLDIIEIIAHQEEEELVQKEASVPIVQAGFHQIRANLQEDAQELHQKRLELQQEADHLQKEKLNNNAALQSTSSIDSALLEQTKKLFQSESQKEKEKAEEIKRQQEQQVLEIEELRQEEVLLREKAEECRAKGTIAPPLFEQDSTEVRPSSEPLGDEEGQLLNRVGQLPQAEENDYWKQAESYYVQATEKLTQAITSLEQGKQDPSSREASAKLIQQAEEAEDAARKIAFEALEAEAAGVSNIFNSSSNKKTFAQHIKEFSTWLKVLQAAQAAHDAVPNHRKDLKTWWQEKLSFAEKKKNESRAAIFLINKAAIKIQSYLRGNFERKKYREVLQEMRRRSAELQSWNKQAAKTKDLSTKQAYLNAIEAQRMAIKYFHLMLTSTDPIKRQRLKALEMYAFQIGRNWAYRFDDYEKIAKAKTELQNQLSTLLEERSYNRIFFKKAQAVNARQIANSKVDNTCATSKTKLLNREVADIWSSAVHCYDKAAEMEDENKKELSCKEARAYEVAAAVLGGEPIEDSSDEYSLRRAIKNDLINQVADYYARAAIEKNGEDRNKCLKEHQEAEAKVIELLGRLINIAEDAVKKIDLEVFEANVFSVITAANTWGVYEKNRVALDIWSRFLEAARAAHEVIPNYRKDLKAWWKEKLLAAEEEKNKSQATISALNKAAIKIQPYFRGFVARSRLKYNKRWQEIKQRQVGVEEEARNTFEALEAEAWQASDDANALFLGEGDTQRPYNYEDYSAWVRACNIARARYEAIPIRQKDWKVWWKEKLSLAERMADAVYDRFQAAIKIQAYVRRHLAQEKMLERLEIRSRRQTEAQKLKDQLASGEFLDGLERLFPAFNDDLPPPSDDEDMPPSDDEWGPPDDFSHHSSHSSRSSSPPASDDEPPPPPDDDDWPPSDDDY